ncbi:MAG: hypothetical protein ACREDS_11435, partial [Limisphaerales bacterium]
PVPPPAISFGQDGKTPAALEHRRWLNSLPDEIAKELPVNDLLGWLTTRYPDFDTAQLLAGFSSLFFYEHFRARFTPAATQDYNTSDQVICAQPVRLEDASK